jgi:hypothetical protein
MDLVQAKEATTTLDSLVKTFRKYVEEFMICDEQLAIFDNFATEIIAHADAELCFAEHLHKIVTFRQAYSIAVSK